MELIERLRAWTHARQCLTQPAGTPLAALKAVVAVYATHPTGPLALAARSSSFTAARYRNIDGDKKGVRMPAMRRTVFLVPRHSAARVFTAVRASPAHALRPLKRHGLSDKDFEKRSAAILQVARSPVAARDLQGPSGLKGQELGAILRALRYQGRLLTIAGDSLNSGAHRYVATEAWIEDELDAGDAAAALAWLAGEYLRAYGPARLEDFAWWTGATKRQAAAALESHDTVDVGDGLLLLERDEAAFGRIKPLKNAVDLLPRWDAYTMGHAPDGRQRFVHPDVQARVYTPIGVGLPGDGNPVVLVDGQVVATWTYSLKDGPDVQPFEKLAPRTKKAVDQRLEEIAALVSS